MLDWCIGVGKGQLGAGFWVFSHVCILNQAVDKKLFEVKRKDQMNALKNLIELNDVNQQYKIIDIMLKGLFKVSLNTAEKRMFAAEYFLDSFKKHCCEVNRNTLQLSQL